MIGTSYHVQIDGVKYQANQVSEAPYVENGEPLRSPASQVVQGEDGSFNMRQDVLRHRWSDWSGGQGSNKYDPQNPNMFWRGAAIDGFSKPGILRVGPGFEYAKNSSNANFAVSTSTPIVRGETLFMGTNGYNWDPTNSRWGAATAITGITGSVLDAVSYGGYLWILDNNSIIRSQALAFFTDWATGITAPSTSPVPGLDNHVLYEFNGKLYLIQADRNTGGDGLKVTEYPTIGSAPVTGTTIFENTELAATITRTRVTSSHNRMYFAVAVGYNSLIFEVVPSTTTAPGYAFVVASVDFAIETLDWVDGILFFSGSPAQSYDRDDSYGKSEIRYFVPAAGTYGAVGKLNPDELAGSTGGHVNREATFASAFVVATNYDGGYMVWYVDAIAGAIHPWAYLPVQANLANFSTLGEIRSSLVVAGPATSSTVNMYRVLPETFQGDDIDPYVLSPLLDFGITDEKILSSFVVSMEEAVPTNWRVDISYMLDDDPNWTTAGSLSATEVNKEIQVSSFASTLKFSSMRMVVQFVWLGAGTPTTTPELQYVEARAQLPDKVRTWVLDLDLSDDASDVDGDMRRGTDKAANIRNLGQSGDVVLFRDGMVSYDADVYESYNVVVDSYQIYFAKPGEGSARVRLVERV